MSALERINFSYQSMVDAYNKADAAARKEMKESYEKIFNTELLKSVLKKLSEFSI